MTAGDLEEQLVVRNTEYTQAESDLSQAYKVRADTLYQLNAVQKKIDAHYAALLKNAPLASHWAKKPEIKDGN